MANTSLTQVTRFSETLAASVQTELRQRGWGDLVRRKDHPEPNQVIHYSIYLKPATDTVTTRVSIGVEANRRRSFTFSIPRQFVDDQDYIETVWKDQIEKFDDLEPFVETFIRYLETRGTNPNAYSDMLSEWDAVTAVMDRDKVDDGEGDGLSIPFDDVEFAKQQLEKARFEEEAEERRLRDEAEHKERQRKTQYQSDPMSGLF
tara:strand:- start:50 stop:661 length:612 start_codon:yes stop_codon:yes gene_type:complete